MVAVLIALNIVAGLFLIAVVLLQSGKGADMGAAFGGASTTVFGASGAGNLLTKITAGTAALFMTTSLLLAVLSSRDQSVFANSPEPEAAAPAMPNPAPPDGQPTDGVDSKAAAEARGQEPLVNDETDLPHDSAPGGGPASSDSANDLGPAGQADGSPSSDAAPAAGAATDEQAKNEVGTDALGNPVQRMDADNAGAAPGGAATAPAGNAADAPAGAAPSNATGGTPTNPTGATPSNPTGAPPANPAGSPPAPAAPSGAH